MLAGTSDASVVRELLMKGLKGPLSQSQQQQILEALEVSQRSRGRPKPCSPDGGIVAS